MRRCCIVQAQHLHPLRQSFSSRTMTQMVHRPICYLSNVTMMASIFQVRFDRKCFSLFFSNLFAHCQKRTSLLIYNQLQNNNAQWINNLSITPRDKFIKMKVKFNNDVLQLKHPFSIRSSRPKRDLSTFKYKILPSLKTINNAEYQEIDYRAYEKLRKNRKIQLLRPANATQFYLEGEMAYTAPRQKKYNSNQDNLLQLFASKNKESTAEQLNGRKKPERQSSTKSDIVDTPKVEESQLNFLHTREMIPLINHKKVPAISTLSQGNKSEIRKKPTVSFINPNKSFEINRTIDLQKPLLHLDKKELKKIRAESFIVMEYPSLQVVSGCRFKNPSEIASLTKIMTFYTVCGIASEKKIDLQGCLTTVDEEASEMSGTSAELVVGDLLSIEQLLYGLMLPSGNDAAIALAKWGGALLNSTPLQVSDMNAFLMRMNRHAKELQMKASFFGNPHGLPNFRNTSNPYDLALLIAKCLKIPLFCRIVKTQSVSFWITNCGAKKEVVWENTNKLLRRKGFIGVKTGVTVTAGPCLASCFEKDHKKFIIVLLRTNKLSRRFKETRYILGWTLRKLDFQAYGQTCEGILKNDAILDSDNSEDEQQFDYEKVDAKELAKRNKILVYEL